MGWPKGKPRKPKEGNEDTTMPEGTEMSTESSESISTGGTLQHVSVLDVQSDVHADERRDEGEASAGTNSETTDGKVSEGEPAEAHYLHLKINWGTVDLKRAQDFLKALFKAYTEGIDIVRERVRRLPVDRAKCTNCGKLIPDGRWFNRDVHRDPQTQMDSIIVLCSERCFEQFKRGNFTKGHVQT